MPSICKKHGKPRDQIIEAWRGRGGVFSYVGCADCKAEQAAKGAPKRDDVKRDEPKRDEPAASKSKTLGERFGFKF
jgi:hypothetical protein